MSRFLYTFLYTLWKNQFSSAALILILLLASFIVTQKFSFPKQSKNENLFLDIETTIKINLGSILEKFTHRHSLQEHASLDMSQDDCDNDICASNGFLQIEKKSIN